ncbi:MAG: hypothetical protein ACE37K_02205 [Planctomycetota bacterium]
MGALALALVHGCTARPGVVDDARVLPAWRELLAQQATVRSQLLVPELVLPELDPRKALVVVDPNWRVPGAIGEPDQVEKLRTFVGQGGRLVLFGHATRLVSELGVETERPESSVYRWGFDRRARRGDAQLTLHFVSGRVPDLYDGLHGSVSEHSIPVTGGAPCNAALCAWRDGPPRDGEVLARLGEVLDGEPAPLGPPVLLRFRHGRGEVLACGLLPDFEHQQPQVRDNARGFVQRCARWAGAGDRDVVLLALPDRTPLPTGLDRDGPPIVPLLAHWGWQGALYDGEDVDAVRPVDELVREALVPSFQQGADVFELTLTDPQHGAPLAWDQQDPIEPPVSWRGQSLGAGWSGGGFQALAIEAHQRGMLLFGGIDPLPVGDRAAERLVALRMTARELASVRRHGSGAFDGFGLRQWWHDPSGYGVAMVQDYQPSASLYCAGERVPALGGGLRALDADDGGVRGLGLSGVAAGWRDGFAGDLFPIGLLDARALPDRFPGNGVRGGGSRGDWLVQQFCEFVRERRLGGGTALWRRHDPRTLGPRTAAYVQGLSMEPLRAAVATSLAATGQDGIRAAAAALLDEAQPGFGASVAAPAAVHVLQNNWFRLLGSGGALQFDARGLADFGDGARLLSPGFLHTRLYGGRPDGAEMRAERIDFLRHGRRGGGGYGEVELLADAVGVDRRVPELLGHDAAPEWPTAVELEWRPSKGYHELRLQLRPERGQAVVTVSLDGTLLRAIPCRSSGRAPEVVVPVHIARDGTRVLRVEVFEGQTVAIDELVVTRVGDVGVEAEVTVPAGSLAQLVERSSSSYHEERVALTALADVPGFVVRAQCVRAARNLQIERRLALPGYHLLSAATEGDDPKGRRQPFVLGCTDPGMPDLCVVPLQLPRYERLIVEPGAVVWRGAPEAGLAARVGFLLWPQGQGHKLLPHLQRLLDAVDRPLPVDLGPDGKASLTSDLPVPHNRVLHLETDIATPLLVRERGYWTWRACQPASGGGVWLRIHQEPGDVVEVVGGPTVFARTRPGTGALRCVALEDPTPRSVTAHVLQPSRLRAPSVVLATDFDEVTVNGEPWSWFDGRTVFLPDEVGSYRIEARHYAALLPPHVRCTGAPLQRVSFDAAARELVLVTRSRDDRPATLPWTAVLHGPVPSSIENGELVDVDQLHLPDAAAEAAALQGGVLIRFRPGTTTVRYEGWNAAPGR